MKTTWSAPAALAAMMLASLSATAAAQAPALMPVQGYLTDEEGVAVDGEQSVTFRLFDSDVGDTMLHEETQTVMVDQGFFTAYLGDVGTLDLSIFRDNTAVFLEVEIEGETLSPRTQLATVPYAAFAEHSGDAASVGGMAASDFAAASHGHDWTEVSSVPADLADGDDDTTYTAGAGLSMSGTTLSVDTSEIQARVTDSCPAGESIRAIGADGTVTCEPDDSAGGDITGVTAGSGLTGGGTSGTVTLNVGTGAVTATHLATGSVGRSEIASDAVGPAEIEADAVGMGELNPLDFDHGDSVQSQDLTSGHNYVMSTEPVTPSADGHCLVSAAAQVNSATSDTGEGFVRTASSVGTGSPSHDGMTGHYLEAVGGSYSTAVTATAVWDVSGGSTYRFGCMVYGLGDLVGDLATCRVSWMCL